MFVNGILTNADIWYGLQEKDLQELEAIDREMIRKVFKCPFSTPVEAGHLQSSLTNRWGGTSPYQGGYPPRWVDVPPSEGGGCPPPQVEVPLPGGISTCGGGHSKVF